MGLASTPSNVAYCAEAVGNCTATGWTHDITLNIYDADHRRSADHG